MSNNKKGLALLLLLGVVVIAKAATNTSHIIIDDPQTTNDPGSDFLVVVDDEAYIFNKPFDASPVFIQTGSAKYSGYKDSFFPGWIQISMPGTTKRYYVQQGDYMIKK